MADNTNWDKTVPSGTSSIAQGDDDIRSFKSFMQAWWEDEHYGTDGSASSAGEHKEGSARVYVGTESSVSTVADSGRLMWATDAAQLNYVGVDSLHTMPSLGTTNVFLSQQSFDGGVFVSDLTAREHISASTFTGSVAHVDTVIASTLSADNVIGLSGLSSSRVTTDNLIVDAANGEVITGIISAQVVFPDGTNSPAGSSANSDVDLSASGVTNGDAAFCSIQDAVSDAGIIYSVQRINAGTVRVAASNITDTDISLSTTTVNIFVLKH